MDCSPPGFSILGILQARILEWVAISSSRELPDPGIRLTSPALAGRFFTTGSTWEAPYGYIHVSKNKTGLTYRYRTSHGQQKGREWENGENSFRGLRSTNFHS